MIDFDKPMRVKGAEDWRSVRPLEATEFRAFSIANAVCLIDCHGNIYEARYQGRNVENIPEKPEPKRRYQAQYGPGFNGVWREKRDSDDAGPSAWIIETDHGPDVTPRYTYEREEISHD